MAGASVDLVEHELRSLRGWLNGMFPGRPIYITRPTVAFDRPAFMLKRSAPKQFEDRGTGFGVHATSNFQIENLVEQDEDDPVQGFWTAQRECTEISERLLTARVVPLYLYGWQYPPAVLEVLPGAGSLSAGELSVIVTGISHEDEESLGEAVSVTVADGDAVRIWISPWPRQSAVAKEFRVYAGASGSEMQEAVVPVPDPASPVAISHDLAALAGGGSPYSDLTGSRFFYRFMCVDSCSTEVLEHPETDGVFNGFVSVTMSVLSQRRLPFGRPLEDVSISDLEVV